MRVLRGRSTQREGWEHYAGMSDTERGCFTDSLCQNHSPLESILPSDEYRAVGISQDRCRSCTSHSLAAQMMQAVTLMKQRGYTDVIPCSIFKHKT